MAARPHPALPHRALYRALVDDRHLYGVAAEETPDQPLYMTELCATIGVSERTMRVCRQEQLGMSPKRYLMVRRMNLARRALRDNSPDLTTVTEIATRHGFWQFRR